MNLATDHFWLEKPVTKDNMNYTSAALGVIGVISLLTWITTGRKRFTGPIVPDMGSTANESREKSIESGVD